MGGVERNFKKPISLSIHACVHTLSPWLMWRTKLLTSVMLVVSHPQFTRCGQKAASQSPTTFCQRRLAVTWLHTVFQTCKSVCGPSVETQVQASRAVAWWEELLSKKLSVDTNKVVKTWREVKTPEVSSFILCPLLHVHQPYKGLIRWCIAMESVSIWVLAFWSDSQDERLASPKTKAILGLFSDCCSSGRDGCWDWYQNLPASSYPCASDGAS